MAPTIRRVLLDTLEDLTKKQRRKFDARLLDREGEPRVRRGALEDQDDIRVVEVLVDTFTEAGAGRVVVETLRAINHNDLAEKLETSLETLQPVRQQPTVRILVRRPEEHFVDRHRSSLVQRIKQVPAILDRLLDQGVVSPEQYDTLLANVTPQDRVRQLYSGPLQSSGIRGKDIFLKVLQELEPFLIEDLVSMSEDGSISTSPPSDPQITSRRSPGQDLSEQDLLQVARQLGQEWEEAAIQLGLSSTDLYNIKAEERGVNMQKHKMLMLWKKRRTSGEATAQHLLSGLEGVDLSCEARQLLTDKMKKP